MRKIARFAVVLMLALPALAHAQMKKPAGPADAALADIKATLGVVPGFFKLVPPEVLPAAWAEFKGFELNPSTAIPGKYRDLIALGVAAQVPCPFCIYAHTEFAKLQGATEAEIKDAVLMAALTRKWSTILNGSMQDEAQFRKEIDAAFAYVVKMAGKPGGRPIDVVDAASAKRDIQQTLGSVPTFLTRVPPSALAGAWSEWKQVQLNPNTALSGKYKELVGLAVASQIPCRYCIYTHMAAAKLNGATQVEIDEAIACAASVRHWSTFINGMQVDLGSFRRDIDEVIRHVKKMASAR